MRCKACDTQLQDHASRKLIEASLCAPCYSVSLDALLDYDYGLEENVRPDDVHAATWEDKYVRPVYPDSDE